MAFHPFHTFRRHQKKWLAALTIMCMFIFVFSSGIGRSDPVMRLIAWLGVTPQKYTTVATVYGSKVTDHDLDNVRKRRELANTVVDRMFTSAIDTTIFEMDQAKGLEDFDDSDRMTIKLVLGQMRSQTQSLDQRKSQVTRDHYQLRRVRETLLEKGHTEQANKVRQLMAALEYSLWQISRFDRQAGDTLYFGGSLRAAALLDFIMWRHIADKLGITLTQADIRGEINRQTFDYQPLEEDASAALAHVQGFLRVPQKDLTIDEVYTALGDELRVAMAQSAVLGHTPGLRYYRDLDSEVDHVPATATPGEFWTYYRDNRTTLRVEMLPVKVEDFLAEAKKLPEPPQQELEDLFNRYKDDEFAPNREEPAFRVPRRIGIEWVSSRTDSKHVKEQAEIRIRAILAAGAGGSPLPAVALISGLLDDYERNKSFNYAMPSLLDSSFEFSFYRDAIKPQDVAATLAQAAISNSSSPARLAVTLVSGVATRDRAAVAGSVAEEAKRRAAFDATLVLAGMNPLLAGEVFRHGLDARQALPFDVVKKDLLDKVRKYFGRAIMADNLKAVQTELNKLKGKPEEQRKKETEQYLAKAIKDYGLSHGASQKPEDRYHIEEDKGLQVLKQEFKQPPQLFAPTKSTFAELFFDPTPLFVPEHFPQDIAFQGQAFEIWLRSEQPFLYWKTADLKAYTPSFEEARPKVVEAWRFQEARKLALKEAERIQQASAKLKNAGDGLKLLREESAKHPAWGEMFAISNIARLVPDLRRFGAGYQAFLDVTPKPYESHITPRPNFVDQLILSLKEPGDATIVWNQPETIYYVTLAMDVARPDEKQFHREYSSPHVMGDSLWQMMEQDRRRKYYQASLEQLRTEAGAENGRWNVPDDVKKRIEGRESSSEE